MTRLVIVTDAWLPQVNGVVRTIEETRRELVAMGIDVHLITPQLFTSIPCPTYPEIRLSLASFSAISRHLDALQPSLIHIATEGPLGWQARRWCLKHRLPFTTCYHTRFPEYVAARFPVPERWLHSYVRRFHNAGNGCMAATDTLEQELRAMGIERIMRWGRGINSTLFHPRPLQERPFGLPRPIFMTVGRVAIEKNLPAFLDLELPGSKVVVGDGPDRASLEARYPSVHFTGMKTGEDLAEAYAQADVFVFPSRTDTFGNTILEAMASGVPVAAYPVMGPKDIIGARTDIGRLDDNLAGAAIAALQCSREAARHFAEGFTWRAATEQFFGNVLAANGPERAEAIKTFYSSSLQTD